MQFHIGNTKIEEITGEQMQITNELMRTDEARYGTNMILKTGKRPFSGAKSNELITRHKGFFEGNGTAEQFNAAPTSVPYIDFTSSCLLVARVIQMAEKRRCYS